MNLYDIDARIQRAFEDSVDPETGEIVDLEAYSALDYLQIEFNQKMESILLWIKNLEALADALKNEKMALDSRKKAAESKAESLKKYVSRFLDGKKFETGKVLVTWRKSESVEFKGEISKLPKECIKIPEPDINKPALKKILKSGQKIEGASIVVRNNIQIK